MNLVRASEIFRLRPGSSRTLDEWVGAPVFAKPGVYRVVFYYHNIPELGGPVADERRVEILEKIKQTDPCALVSNEVIVGIDETEIRAAAP